MHIKVRLTTAAIQDNPALVESDSDLSAAEALFDSDPLISHDSHGWFLSASVIDAEDSDGPGDIWSTARETLHSINGVAKLLRHGLRINPVILTGEIEGRRSPILARDLITRVSIATFTLDGLDPRSAEELMQIVLKDPIVARVVDLLSRFELETFWFDSFKAYEMMARCTGGSVAFEKWLKGADERLAETLSRYIAQVHNSEADAFRRHDVHLDSKRLRARQQVSDLLTNRSTRPNRTLVVEFSDALRSIAVLWINDDFKLGVRRQH